MSIAILVLCLGAMLALAAVTSESVTKFCLSSTIVIAIALPLFWRSANGKMDIFEPIVPASVSLFAMFFVRPLADEALGAYNHVGYDFSSTFDKGLLFAALGCLSMSIGYICRFGSKIADHIPTPKPHLSKKRGLQVATTLALLASLVFGSFIATSGGLSTLRLFFRGRTFELEQVYRGSTAYVIGAPFLFMPSSLALFALWIAYKKRFFLYASFLVGLPLVIIESSSGNRSTLLPLIASPILVYYLANGKRPRTSTVLLTLGGLLFLSSFIREHRVASSGLVQDGQIGPSGDSSLSSALETLTGNDDEMFDTLCNVISIYPSQKSFKPLGIATDLITRSIPRVVMKDKPLETPDEYMLALWPQQFRWTRGGYADSLIGAFYLYGGVPAIIVYSFCTGIMLRGISEWYRRNRGNLNVILVVSFAPTLIVVLLRGTMPDTLGRCAYTLFPLLLGIRYWAASKPKRAIISALRY